MRTRSWLRTEPRRETVESTVDLAVTAVTLLVVLGTVTFALLPAFLTVRAGRP